ncbi:MAG: nucleotide exchange factor GrpE [Bacteroidia bacterium]|nr:nucleotide exchange factor GrpE [Bacteroidia bacterium]
MMKKKIKDQAESKEKNLNKTTDNKENTNISEKNNSFISEIPSSGDSTKPASDGLNGGDASADKVVSEEKPVEEKLAEMQDKYIRLSAEFDNYRKRTLREKMDLSKYAGEDLLLKIIPIMDDFERALKLMDTATDCAAMKNGIDFIYGKFSEFLKQNGIKEIESLNSNFNVDLHEAVAKIPVEENDKKGKVVDVVLKGYYLQDKVLRFSKVIVGE